MLCSLLKLLCGTAGAADQLFSMDKLQGYISLVKTIQPQMTPDSNRFALLILSKHVQILLATYCAYLK